MVAARPGYPTSVVALTARGGTSSGRRRTRPNYGSICKDSLAGAFRVSRIKPPYFCKFTLRHTLALTLIPHPRLGVPSARGATGDDERTIKPERTSKPRELGK